MSAPHKSLMAGVGLAQLSKLLAESQEAGAIERRPFQVPDLPPGVVPQGAKVAIASDSAVAMNGWLGAQPGLCGLGFPGYSYLAELAQRSEYRAPTVTLASQVTREWIELTGGDDAKLKELSTALEDFGVRECFHDLVRIDGFYGRAQLAINIKGQETDKGRALPLVLDGEGRGMAKGSLLGFKPIEAIWTTPWQYNSIDATKADFYTPQWWYVIGKRTHASRLLTYVSNPLPDILKPSYNFGGIATSQLIEPYVIRFLKTVDSVNRMLSNYSTSGIMTDMEAQLAGDGSGMDMYKRAALFNATKDNRGLMLLDKSSEEFFQYNTPLSGLSELQAQAQEHMAAPTHQPLVVLTGITPSGLNASSEGEIKVWYDWVGGYQKDVPDPLLRTVLKAVQIHLWGKVDPDIKHIWVPLDSPSDKEESEMRKADGDRDAAYVTNGIVSADEVRQRLRQEKKSGYAFVEGPAPPPPLQQEADIGEEGKDADHARGQENADADHERAKEMEKLKAKNKPAAKK